MAEVIVDLPLRIVDGEGTEFYVSAAGRARADGSWEGWLEYVPTDDSEPLLTPTETTQSNRRALQHWAEALTETYVQGAFRRAVAATSQESANISDAALPYAVRRHILDYDIAAAEGVPDPFELFAQGRDAMRLRLTALPRPMLLSVIAGFGLNPSGKSLGWLTDRQLVIFIVTAVEAQIAMGRRS
jgi:hypothetical protein